MISNKLTIKSHCQQSSVHVPTIYLNKVILDDVLLAKVPLLFYFYVEIKMIFTAVTSLFYLLNLYYLLRAAQEPIDIMI